MSDEKPKDEKPETKAEEKPKTRYQIIGDKVAFIIKRGWDQFKSGNQATDIVWKKGEEITNLETAFLSENMRDKKAEAGKVPGGKQGPGVIPALTPAQKKELAEKAEKEKIEKEAKEKAEKEKAEKNKKK